MLTAPSQADADTPTLQVPAPMTKSDPWSSGAALCPSRPWHPVPPEPVGQRSNGGFSGLRSPPAQRPHSTQLYSQCIACTCLRVASVSVGFQQRSTHQLVHSAENPERESVHFLTCRITGFPQESSFTIFRKHYYQQSSRTVLADGRLVPDHHQSLYAPDAHSQAL